MIIKNAEFYKSIKNKEDFFNYDMPEIAIVGKSNVGKSSLINMLTKNSKLARVSKQPGKTRLINYFLINKNFYLVDLPGYGFARVSKEEKISWDRMMTGYFESAQNLKLVIILMDIRHKPSEDDKMMLRFVEQYGFTYMIGATKADKIAKSKRKNELFKLRRECPTSYVYDMVALSNEGIGKEELLDVIEKYLTMDNDEENA